MRRFLLLIWMLGCGLVAYGQASSISPAKMLRGGSANTMLITNSSGIVAWGSEVRVNKVYVNTNNLSIPSAISSVYQFGVVQDLNDFGLIVYSRPPSGPGYGLRSHTYSETASDYIVGYSSGVGSGSFKGSVRGNGDHYINNFTTNGNIVTHNGSGLLLSSTPASLQASLNYWTKVSSALSYTGSDVTITNTKTIKLDATDGYIDLPDVSTELGGGVHNNGNGELWYNPSLYRLRYTRNDRNATVASVEEDFVGYSIVTSTSNPTMVGSEWYLEEFDGVSNAVNVTVGASLFEGKIYTVRCRRNVVAAGGNLITFYAASGYTFAVDGVSTLTPTSYTPGDYEVFTMRRMGTVIVINK